MPSTRQPAIPRLQIVRFGGRYVTDGSLVEANEHQGRVADEPAPLRPTPDEAGGDEPVIEAEPVGAWPPLEEGPPKPAKPNTAVGLVRVDRWA